MAPPVLIIAGGAVIAVGGIVAFHQFVYEPHIAPKLEIFVENWLEQRRLRRRRLTGAVSFGDVGDEPGRSLNASHATTHVEMDTISAPLNATGINSGVSAASLRRRSNPTGAHHDSFVLESPNVFIPFGALTPVSTADPLPDGPLLSSPRLSTPSTVSSSLMELPSPSLRGTASPAAFDTRSSSDHSRRSSSDSILADATHLSFTAISPAHSVTHISPRALFITLTSPIVPAAPVDEDSRPLSDFTRVRRRDTVTYPSLAITPQAQDPQSPTRSLTGSTIYESFAPSPRSISPVDPPLNGQVVHEDSSASTRGLRFPSPDRLLPPGQRAPRSTTSWSDMGSDGGDEPEFLVGSDVESWASVSDRAG